MNLARNTTLWLAFLTTLGSVLTKGTNAQLAIPASAANSDLADLPVGTITKLPRPTAEYDAKIRIDFGWKHFNLDISSCGAHSRYDKVFFGTWVATYWADFNTEKIASRARLKRLELSGDNTEIDLSKLNRLEVRIEPPEKDSEIIQGQKTILVSVDGPFMGKRRLAGKIWFARQGYEILRIEGRETNPEKGNKPTHLHLEVTDLMLRPQDKVLLMPPPSP